MSTYQDVAAKRSSKPSRRSLTISLLVAALIVAMALDTTVVRTGSDLDFTEEAFSPEQFGATEFPAVQQWIEENAVGVQLLVQALEDDRDAAITQHGRQTGAHPIFPVSFTGRIEEGQSGIVEVAVDQAPDDLTIRLQLGPAINGTELRDVTGTIRFQQFTNQIEYQNAGRALNNAMRADTLDPIDRDQLEGRLITVSGAFTLINPNNWLVTPARVTVQ
ncbi:MAG: DUF2291 domain-containing protein [Natronospirillum sp.]|uniref:DUF2291 family protein n=1 Tax=Natronospirillum sp. TaxID=2812955 RepID=UPI0025DB3D97|nr:DUF2291 domain-containing protein [Natronospirillum sp.]MCH8551890.1 DUF2291 domain-containing protein [Natronospirillum sp.]